MSPLPACALRGPGTCRWTHGKCASSSVYPQSRWTITYRLYFLRKNKAAAWSFSKPSAIDHTVSELMPSTASDVQSYRISVVIPTLGGDCLGATLAALNRGTLIPAEILLCIPRDYAHRAEHLTASNVRVHVTDSRGQVAQRADGFRHVAHPIVLQLDDDLSVAPDCLELLLETLLREGPRAAVSPALIDRDTGESLYKKPDRNGLIEALYYRLMNGAAGYEQGRVQRSTGAVGVDPERNRQALYHVEWLPGGCVLHYRQNLVLENFYPLPGKAYCEDIIHSLHLTRRGIRLLVEPRATCAVEAAADATLSVPAFLKEASADLGARLYYRSLTGGPRWRLFLLVTARYRRYAAQRLAAVGKSEGVEVR